jgi:DNA polymerase I-like protein with 3'-5' exonuclease and polymerase domains
MTLVSLDIETACDVAGCDRKGCAHALDSFRNRISVIGLYYVSNGVPERHTFRDLPSLRRHLESLGKYHLVGHNLKFDLRVLAAKGCDLSANWADDTLLMAATLTEKISPEWMEWYERERKRHNELLPRGHSHRQGSPHSLKCLAPFFLGVEPFWEDPTNHDNDVYVLKDVEYTFRLAAVFEAKLKDEGVYEFYKTKLLPWTRMLLEMEQKGITLDMQALDFSEVIAQEEAIKAKAKLDQLWASAYYSHRKEQEIALLESYTQKEQQAVSKLKNPTYEKAKATRLRYLALYEKAVEKLPATLNLDSPAQLSWLLRDHFKLDITDFHGEEGTGKPILQKLAEKREDLKLFLEYRKQKKLTTAFFPSYREMQWEGRLHCSFNPTGTRTGRLSSSTPNLQQVPAHLHRLFRARPGHKLATYDMSAIEPRLIAYYTHDLRLIDIVNSGEDFHGNNARIFFGLDCETKDIKERYPNERKMAKEVGLSLFYGAGSGRLEETSQKYGFMWNSRRCRDILKRFKEEYEGVYAFRDGVLNPLLSAGHTVTNLLGRQYRIDDPTDVHLQGLNTLIQSSASDLVINSAHRITERLKVAGIPGSVLLLVHDEIVTEVPEDCVGQSVILITDAMTSYHLPTPLGPIRLEVEGKVADSWEK